MKTDEDILRLNIILEDQAFNSYKEDALFVEDPSIAKILENIMKDEASHSERFMKALQMLKGEKEEEEESPLLVFQRAVEKGIKRLSRPWLEMFMSGVIGAVHVTFGAVAMAAAAGATFSAGKGIAALVGAVFFPIGFILLKLSQSELFTENFLVPVIPVLEKQERIFKLLKLWVLTLLGNLTGALLFFLLVKLGGNHSLGALPGVFLKHFAMFKLSRSFLETFVSALFAGAIITTMTWLVLATQSDVAKLIAVWACIFVMAIGHFTHVVVSTSEILLGNIFGAKVTFKAWFFKLFVPATFGNTLGGMLLIALLHYLQVLHSKKAHYDYLTRRDEALKAVIREKLRL
ncbi:formate uptake permease [Thermosulfidibacter takaii ABI70S6]|uniref:Formate uptake permease n=2 Tax=Thermosulfidibacter takaii TaxID=412593 RepID=A0A0S3QUW5_THET7|nr:formate uptake permease [Thermosulfidibacter takaii ABI70S6]